MKNTTFPQWKQQQQKSTPFNTFQFELIEKYDDTNAVNVQNNPKHQSEPY